MKKLKLNLFICLFTGTAHETQARAQTRDKKKKKMSDEEIHSRLRMCSMPLFSINLVTKQNKEITDSYQKFSDQMSKKLIMCVFTLQVPLLVLEIPKENTQNLKRLVRGKK